MSTVSLKTFLHPRHWHAWPLLGFLLVMSRMPGRALWHIGNSLGALFSLLPSPSCRFAARNIHMCFPHMNAGERRVLVRRHFRLCAFATLSLGVAFFAPRRRVKQFITLSDKHYVEKALSDGKRVILFAPHFLGLDMAGSRISAEWQIVSMYRKSRDPFLEYLFQRRSRFGAVVVERMASLKPVIRLIREGRPFYYLPDQDMGERASVFVPFFGIPAATVTALSRIAQTTNAVVVPCVTRILPDECSYDVRFYPPLENFPTDDPEADAARMNSEIEKFVREMPDQYMWSYRRFKTRPNGEPSLYK